MDNECHHNTHIKCCQAFFASSSTLLRRSFSHDLHSTWLRYSSYVMHASKEYECDGETSTWLNFIVNIYFVI